MKRQRERKENQVKFYALIRFSIAEDPFQFQWLMRCIRHHIISITAFYSLIMAKRRNIDDYGLLHTLLSSHSYNSVHFCVIVIIGSATLKIVWDQLNSATSCVVFLSFDTIIWLCLIPVKPTSGLRLLSTWWLIVNFQDTMIRELVLYSSKDINIIRDHCFWS